MDIIRTESVQIEDLFAEMQQLNLEFKHGAALTSIRNAIIHTICSYTPQDDTTLPASCQAISEALPAEISEAIPSKDSPTSLGCAGLPTAPLEELKDEELAKFLHDHNLQELSNMEGINWKACKLQYALMKNPKLINPNLTVDKVKALKIMLLETAACLATRIEDLHRPCNVAPVDIPTSSPPIRQKGYKLSPTDVAFLEPTIQSMLKAGVLQPSSSPWASPVFVVYR